MILNELQKVNIDYKKCLLLHSYLENITNYF